MLTLPPTPLHPGDRPCIAISGGADSTALLLLTHAANTLPRNALGLGLSAIHINHSLRAEESEADQVFVQTLCQALGIPLHLRTVDTRSHAQTHHQTIEEAARNLRYSAFAELLQFGDATHILTAHTLDDQAETVLHKLLRGAWLEGLSAISPTLPGPAGEAGRILRPLLNIRREALRQYLTNIRQPWREDSSNLDQSFTRNRLRHTILPLLREENPQLDHALANLAELAREEESRWAAELQRLLPQLLLPGKPVRGGGRSNSGSQTVAMELDRLRSLDPALRRRVLRAAAAQLGCRLSFAETARLLALAGFPASPPDPTVPTKSGSRLQLSGQLLAERSPRELRLTRSARTHSEPNL